MISGSCLCGRVRFEVDRLVGPFELCHCSRCHEDPDLRPDEHIFVEAKAPWVTITDELPCFAAKENARHRGWVGE